METANGQASSAISDELRALVAEELTQVLAGESFRNSKQAEKLLRYLVSHSLDEDEDGLRERAIGEKVFGRAPKYDSNTDSIVRVWANHLRKRLAHYYLAEGASSTLRFAIKPGSYRVEFQTQVRETPTPAPVPVQVITLETGETAPTTQAPPRPSIFLAAALSLVVLLAIACAWLVFQNSQLRSRVHEPKLQPPLNLLWSRMFGGKQATQIVLADSNLSLFQDLLGKPVSLQDYVRHNYLLMGAEPGNQKALSLLMMRRYTSLADIDVLRRTLLLQDPESNRLEVIFARDFAPDDLKRRNVILVGSKRANPWVETFEAQMNFRFDYNTNNGSGAIVNTHPRAGEQSSYFNSGPIEQASESYGLLAFQPNLEHTGNAVIIAGLGMEGTLAAGELATSADLFKHVVSLFGTRADLPYFEVLLKADMVGSSVHGFKLVAWRSS